MRTIHFVYFPTVLIFLCCFFLFNKYWEFQLLIRNPVVIRRVSRLHDLAEVCRHDNGNGKDETSTCTSLNNSRLVFPSGDTPEYGNTTTPFPDEETREPRVLCWILCDQHDLEPRVQHVKATWAQRCDMTLYMSSSENKEFPTIGLNAFRGRNHIALKAKEAWKYIYSNHFSDADFFLKADPDTYVIMENLKEYLASRNTSEPEFYGHPLVHPDLKKGIYMSGGPGLVLTKESLKRLVTVAFEFETNCMPDGQGEDYKTGFCLGLVGVRPVDTRDDQGRSRFIIFNPGILLYPGLEHVDWFVERDTEGAVAGPICCSNYPISFHYIKPEEMYALEYYLYRVKKHSRQE